MPTTILCSIGTRSADNITVSSVSGSDPGPYTVTLNAAVPATTKVGDTIIDSAARTYLIEGISGSDLTVYKRHFGAAADPSTGAGTTQRAYSGSNCVSNWMAAGNVRTLTSTDEVWKGEVWNDGAITQTTTMTMQAPSDATRYMWLTTATGQSFKDHADKLTNALRPNQSNGVLVTVTTHTAAAVVVDSAYGIFENIQINDTRTSNSYTVLYGATTHTNYGTIRNVVFRTTSTGVIINPRRVNIVNVAGICTANGTGMNSSSAAVGKMSCITLVNISGSSTKAAIVTGSAAPVIDNSATFGWGADNASAAGSNNNATDRASFGGSSTSNQTSLTITDQIYSITSSSEDLRAKSTGALPNNGVRDQTYTNDLDIVGQSRSTTTPTIGCWEYVAGGGDEEAALTGSALTGGSGTQAPSHSIPL